jgi:hypothetical protein
MADNLNLIFRVGIHVPNPNSTGPHDKIASLYQDLQVNATAREVGGKIVGVFASMLGERQLYPQIVFTIADLPTALKLENVAKHTVGNDPRLFSGLVEDPASFPGMSEVENKLLQFIRFSEIQFLTAHRDKPETTDLNQGDSLGRTYEIAKQFMQLSETPQVRTQPGGDPSIEVDNGEFVRRFNQLVGPHALSNEQMIAALKKLLVDTTVEILADPNALDPVRMKQNMGSIANNYQAAADVARNFR